MKQSESVETKSARCEQALTGCPCAAWDQLAFVMTIFYTATCLYVLNTDFFFDHNMVHILLDSLIVSIYSLLRPLPAQELLSDSQRNRRFAPKQLR